LSTAMVDNLLRRLLDVLASLVGLLLLSPLFLLLAILIRLDSAGPIFYRAQRVGKDGVLFYLYKFRSMKDGADKQGPGITAAGDSRVTRIGRFLRRTKLDELPQLINVLKGEMSLVGPRPEDPRYVALYTPEQRRVLAVRPGITSAASLQYRHEEEMLSGMDWETIYCQEVMPAKIALDLAYLQMRTVWTDFRLVGKTVLAMFC
jgi:lipopolysaccharide/colanic/teichoic acid biosynthesis glycosyltransferase